MVYNFIMNSINGLILKLGVPRWVRDKQFFKPLSRFLHFEYGYTRAYGIVQSCVRYYPSRSRAHQKHISFVNVKPNN